ncbi:MAG TPA: 50S ribosomal protein L29 [Patescibacteria group bacterium]|nr:50S ribosomal protein L29 [Patescibacteria group bacterium]
MKFKELKNKNLNELQKILDEFRNKVRELRFKSAADQLKNVREIRAAKKVIARSLFLIQQKKQDSSKLNQASNQ